MRLMRKSKTMLTLLINLRVFRAAWQHRAELDGTPRQSHEASFLPAALALQESPVSPLPRVLIWLLMAFAGIAVLWAVFGEVEIVATAQGKIIASGYTKIIQPMETATVKAIHVTDGQRVKAGDPLIDLDATSPPPINAGGSRSAHRAARCGTGTGLSQCHPARAGRCHTASIRCRCHAHGG